MKKSTRKKKAPKRVLRLPDLDYAKGAVLNTLGSPASKRSYEFAIDDFVAWYCSEPRLAFSKTVVLRYRLELESRHLAPATIKASSRRVRFPLALLCFHRVTGPGAAVRQQRGQTPILPGSSPVVSGAGCADHSSKVVQLVV